MRAVDEKLIINKLGPNLSTFTTPDVDSSGRAALLDSNRACCAGKVQNDMQEYTYLR